jgi:hypothetical protein
MVGGLALPGQEYRDGRWKNLDLVYIYTFLQFYAHLLLLNQDIVVPRFIAYISKFKTGRSSEN